MHNGLTPAVVVLEQDQRLFGVPLSRLLSVDGVPKRPERVHRKIVSSGHTALLPEEAWVRRQGRSGRTRSSRCGVDALDSG